MNRGVAYLLDFLFPCYCVSCGVPVSSDSNYLCRDCFMALKPVKNGCPVCSSVISGEPCAFCESRKFYPARHISLFEYEGSAKKIIHALKFEGIRDAYRNIIPFFNNIPGEILAETDIITYVPMSRKKYAARGYNQSELVARELSAISGIPLLKLLRERGNSIAQRELSFAARYVNVIDRYETIDNVNTQDSTILLIDDVFTTGATVNECSRQLLSSGASKVFSLTIARSDLKKLENI